MRLTVLGGGGAYPTPERGCSGYLIEHAGFRLLLDPGYATLPALLEHVGAAAVDAVFVSHAHGDHCAGLNPLLRILHLDPDHLSPLPVFALPGAVDPVLALDADMKLDDQADVHEFDAGAELTVGPFTLHTASLSHFVDNVGLRIETGGVSLAYSGDGGADPALRSLAAQATVLLTEATFVEDVPPNSRGSLSSAALAAEYANLADVGRLVLTHLWPGTDPDDASRTARRGYAGPIDVATPGLIVDVR
ncbi:MBL fold metallo-hydrolase [uncultured Jatrophihabitans sp.]|uniref:MBL fold metallo-hydrolase n=1 Tax=uncultured Jatrophihabitans sp. TaxID=1610747 RepID=UPI0035CB3060